MRVITAFALAVLIHELGHVTVARILGVPLISFSKIITGLSMQFDFSRASFFKEALVHLGGSLFGILSAALAALLGGRFFLTYAGISLTFAAVNLLPLSSFDGAGILAALLSAFFLPDTVWTIMQTVSAVTLIFLWVGVIWIELRVGANIGLIAFACALMVKTFSTSAK